MTSLYIALVIIMNTGRTEPVQFLEYEPTQKPAVCEINTIVDRDESKWHVTCYSADGKTVVYHGTAVRAVEV